MKKKAFLLFVIFSIFFTGCNINEVLSSKDKSNGGDTSTTRDIEEDVNSVNIKEDEDLTEKAEAENKTEEDTLISQEEVKEDANIENIQKEEYVTIETFNTQLPDSINEDIKYNKYSTSYNYFLILSKSINIREKPTTNSKVLGKGSYFEKINIIESVKGQYIKKYNNDLWYKVFWKEGGNIKYGYVFSLLGQAREFQFHKMVESLNILKNEVENNKTAYIANYKNRNGKAPYYKGKTTDNYGERRYQSAPAYAKPSAKSKFRYIPDGTLVSIVGKSDKYYKITTLNFKGEYWVPKRFVSFRNSIKNLKKVVVVDRKNQNEAVFQYGEGKWNLISYVFATTGEKSKYKLETPLGHFMAIEKKTKFLYFKDGTREIAGYAPYAIRFMGGSYIHGVPVSFKIVDDKRIDPGMREYLFTIGTVPRSHRCVRNYTSHAKFLYDWITIGESAVIVIE
ncbi:SH3 domain-containing protein [Anaeromicrobium sediminis]|uniref:L,D-TPase catalytic domain-containing protein n=1 Tax=Anaeromicrobium sediminis TaxID=1478221 RepID=A0A267MG32_9FIRM|nr:SH3 domain-containing protein [Anaeromicrobium sediminis]PAB57835.1 hypothetical protein CCE28_17690 [Anaeromicrobium sediminis]